jgi:hypothetical protein
MELELFEAVLRYFGFDVLALALTVFAVLF